MTILRLLVPIQRVCISILWRHHGLRWQKILARCPAAPKLPGRSAAVAALLILTCNLANAELIPLFVNRTATPTGGDTVNLALHYLNSGPTPANIEFPKSVSARLENGLKALPLELTIHASDDPSIQSVSPGGFAARDYTASIPAGIVGRAILSFDSVRASPIVLEIQADTSVTGPDPDDSEDRRRRSLLTEAQQTSKPYSPEQFFREHFFGYEPFYFIAGTESPNAKFQVSLRYQLLNQDGALARHVPFLKGLSVAYTQTSLWDWNSPSAPFFDSSYKPELLYVIEQIDRGKWADWFRLDLQGGLQHESNGKGGVDSRSLNIAYFRPRITLGREDGFQFGIIPRVWTYVGEVHDNPDIADYRGYADLRLTAGWARGVQVSALGRIGHEGRNESLQVDLTYPMMRLLSGSFSVYLHAQYFTGYGESFLLYNERGDSFRIGFGLYR